MNEKIREGGEKRRAIYRTSGWAWGYRNVALFSEEGRVTDNTVCGIYNGFLHVTFAQDYDTKTFLLYCDFDYMIDDVAVIFSEKNRSGRKYRKFFELMTRDEFREKYTVHAVDEMYVRDSEFFIVVTSNFVDYIEKLRRNYEINQREFNEKSVEEPFLIAKKTIDDLREQLRKCKERYKDKREENIELQNEISEIKRKLRDSESEKYKRMIEHMQIHPHARAKDLLRRFA